MNFPTDVGIVFNLWGLKTSESTWTQRWSLYSANKKSRTIGPAIQKFHRGRICQRFHSKFSCCLSAKWPQSPWGWGKLYPRSSCSNFKQLEDFISEKHGVKKVGLNLKAHAITRKVAPKRMEIERAEWQSIFTGQTLRKMHGWWIVTGFSICFSATK